MDKIDKEKAQTNPSSVFEKPADVVKNKDLSAKEKTKALQEWELDARLVDVAAEEGMIKSGAAEATKVKKNVLPEVQKAQEQLGAKPIKTDGPTKT